MLGIERLDIGDQPCVGAVVHQGRTAAHRRQGADI